MKKDESLLLIVVLCSRTQVYWNCYPTKMHRGYASCIIQFEFPVMGSVYARCISIMVLGKFCLLFTYLHVCVNFR